MLVSRSRENKGDDSNEKALPVNAPTFNAGINVSLAGKLRNFSALKPEGCWVAMPESVSARETPMSFSKRKAGLHHDTVWTPDAIVCKVTKEGSNASASEFGLPRDRRTNF